MYSEEEVNDETRLISDLGATVDHRNKPLQLLQELKDNLEESIISSESESESEMVRKISRLKSQKLPTESSPALKSNIIANDYQTNTVSNDLTQTQSIQVQTQPSRQSGVQTHEKSKSKSLKRKREMEYPSLKKVKGQNETYLASGSANVSSVKVKSRIDNGGGEKLGHDPDKNSKRKRKDEKDAPSTEANEDSVRLTIYNNNPPQQPASVNTNNSLLPSLRRPTWLYQRQGTTIVTVNSIPPQPQGTFNQFNISQQRLQRMRGLLRHRQLIQRVLQRQRRQQQIPVRPIQDEQSRIAHLNEIDREISTSARIRRLRLSIRGVPVPMPVDTGRIFINTEGTVLFYQVSFLGRDTLRVINLQQISPPPSPPHTPNQ